MVSLQKEKEIQHTSGGFLTHLAVQRNVFIFFLNCYKLELSGGKSNLHLVLYNTFVFLLTVCFSFTLCLTY